MKKFMFSTVLFLVLVSIGTFSSAQIVKSYDRPSERELHRAERIVLNRTSCLDADTTRRFAAMHTIQREFNNLTKEEWNAYRAYYNNPKLNAEAIRTFESSGTGYFYIKAIEKVAREVRRFKVPQGHYAVWYVYDMGYIVKTPSHCFSIDLNHHRADFVADLLEFNLVTHNHGDHFNPRMQKIFASSGTKVYTGFPILSPVEGLSWSEVSDGQVLNFDGDLSIRCTKCDHNSSQAGHLFVTAYEICLGSDVGDKVIYHVGDCANYTQLDPQMPVDLFIFHLAVGLDMDAACRRVTPELALFSHLWEFGHAVEKWRWTVDDFISRQALVECLPFERKLMPCWGDRLLR